MKIKNKILICTIHKYLYRNLFRFNNINNKIFHSHNRIVTIFQYNTPPKNMDLPSNLVIIYQNVCRDQHKKFVLINFEISQQFVLPIFLKYLETKINKITYIVQLNILSKIC